MSAIFNTARNSDIDRRLIESLDDAEAVLGHYLVLEGDLRPHSFVALDDMAVERAKAHPRLDHTNQDDVMLVYSRLQGALKELCVNELTRLDRTYLDMDGDLDGPAWQSTSTPAIVFCSLRSTDTLYREGRQVALAVYFDPSLVATRTSTGRGGNVYSKPDVYDSSGYVSVVRAFASVDHAKAAKAELEQALTMIRRPISDTALEDDDVRMATLVDDYSGSPVDLDSF